MHNKSDHESSHRGPVAAKMLSTGTDTNPHLTDGNYGCNSYYVPKEQSRSNCPMAFNPEIMNQFYSQFNHAGICCSLEKKYF